MGRDFTTSPMNGNLQREGGYRCQGRSSDTTMSGPGGR
jgi:hypothetical protein